MRAFLGHGRRCGQRLLVGLPHASNSVTVQRGGDVSADSKQSDEARGAALDERDPPSGAIPKSALGTVPEAKRGLIYTMTAREGVDASELVHAAFSRKTVGKLTPRRVEVVAPDGPSTAGGKRARQTIRLVPASGEGSPVMCGSLDVAQKIVELRGYEALVQQYEARFGEACDIAEAEYAALCKDLQMVLTPFRYTFAFESETRAAAARRVASQLTGSEQAATVSEKAPLLNIVLLTILALLAAGLAVALLR
jgi:hypothetical protein